MVFRANEEIENNFNNAVRYLTKGLSINQKKPAIDMLQKLTDAYGSIVHTYPLWHPLVSIANNNAIQKGYYEISPQNMEEYRGLDHNTFFVNGFITCPYEDRLEIEKIIDSVHKLNQNFAENTPLAHFSAYYINTTLYSQKAKPILISCTWNKDINDDHTIPQSLAIPLLLKLESEIWTKSQFLMKPCYDFGEDRDWENMCPYLLGQPNGKRSSLFVNQSTGFEIKKVWNFMRASKMNDPTNFNSVDRNARSTDTYEKTEEFLDENCTLIS